VCAACSLTPQRVASVRSFKYSLQSFFLFGIPCYRWTHAILSVLGLAALINIFGSVLDTIGGLIC
jgi:hypothetical protein